MLRVTRLGAIDLGEHLAQHQLESMIDIRRDHAGNGKRRRDRVMGLRWVAAGLARAHKQFRPINDPLHPAALRAALEAIITLLRGRAADSRHPAPGNRGTPPEVPL